MHAFHIDKQYRTMIVDMYTWLGVLVGNLARFKIAAVRRAIL